MPRKKTQTKANAGAVLLEALEVDVNALPHDDTHRPHDGAPGVIVVKPKFPLPPPPKNVGEIPGKAIRDLVLDEIDGELKVRFRPE